MSILPLGYSVLGDLFPPKSRGAMGTWLIVSMGAGTILGQLMSGLLGPTIGWRMTFIFASLPGTMMALWTSNVLTMPKRGEMDNKRSVEMVDLENPIDRHSNNNNNKINGSDSSSNGNNNSSGGTNKNKYSTILDSNDVADNDRDSGNLYSFKEDDHFIIQDTLDTNAIGSNNTNRNNSTTELIKVIFSTKSNLLLFAQCVPGSIPWGVLFVFMNDFLAQDKGLTVEQATMMISLFGVGAAIGGAIGGVLGQKMYNIKPQYLSLFMGVVRRLRLMVMK
jgi:predicted MFS family arabinose efflux permease